MNKFRIALSATLGVITTACLMQTSSQTPSVNPTSATVTAVFTGDPLKYASPTPSVSPSSAGGTGMIQQTPLPVISSSPVVSLSPSPTPDPTYPPDVLAKKLSFVDWQQYPGVQYFRREGRGLHLPLYGSSSSKFYIGGIEVERKTKKLIAQIGKLSTREGSYGFSKELSTPTYWGWGAMAFDTSLGGELWKFEFPGGLSYSSTSNEAWYYPLSQEALTEHINGFDSLLDGVRGYDENNKTLRFVTGVIPGAPEFPELSLSEIENPILNKENLNRQIGGSFRYPYVGVWEHLWVSANQINQQDYFTRAVTVGEKAVYLVLPDFTKQTFTVYAFLLPNLDRIVEFDLPFIKKESFFTNDGSLDDSISDIVVLRYHPGTKKLYLYVEGRSNIMPRIMQYVPDGLDYVQLLRFSEEYILQ